jgi:hypothetical protein
MAHLWIEDADGWGAKKLDGTQFDLAARSVRTTEGSSAASAKAAQLVRADAGGSPAWALIAPTDSGVRVNSRALPAGLSVLSNRDEIRIGGEVQYFSTETLAEVVPFPGSVRAVYCARCRQEIEVGSPAVCCPNCGIWYNQSAELPCWTYAEKCAFCGHPTTLDSGFTWTPEEA